MRKTGREEEIASTGGTLRNILGGCVWLSGDGSGGQHNVRNEATPILTTWSSAVAFEDHSALCSGWFCFCRNGVVGLFVFVRVLFGRAAGAMPRETVQHQSEQLLCGTKREGIVALAKGGLPLCVLLLVVSKGQIQQNTLGVERSLLMLSVLSFHLIGLEAVFSCLSS